MTRDERHDQAVQPELVRALRNLIGNAECRCDHWLVKPPCSKCRATQALKDYDEQGDPLVRVSEVVEFMGGWGSAMAADAIQRRFNPDPEDGER